MDTVLFVSRVAFAICIGLPVVLMFVAMNIDFRRRMSAEIINTDQGDFVELRFTPSVAGDIQIKKIFIPGVKIYGFSPFVLPSDGGVFRFPCRRSKASSRWMNRSIALLTSNMRIMSLVITKMRTISASR